MISDGDIEAYVTYCAKSSCNHIGSISVMFSLEGEKDADDIPIRSQIMSDINTALNQKIVELGYDSAKVLVEFYPTRIIRANGTPEKYSDGIPVLKVIFSCDGIGDFTFARLVTHAVIHAKNTLGIEVKIIGHYC